MKKLITLTAALALGLTLGAAGTSVASDVQRLAKDSVKSKNIVDGTIRTKDLNPSTVAQLKGQTGPAGTPGQAIVANVTTSASTPGADQATGLVPLAAELASVFTSAKGTALVSASLPAGRYIVSGTVEFFAVGASTSQYGEARLFTADGTPQGSSIFSPVVPPAALGGVGAQTGASVEINLTAATTITLRARVRDTTGGASAVEAGANLLITKVG